MWSVGVRCAQAASHAARRLASAVLSSLKSSRTHLATNDRPPAEVLLRHTQADGLAAALSGDGLGQQAQALRACLRASQDGGRLTCKDSKSAPAGGWLNRAALAVRCYQRQAPLNCWRFGCQKEGLR